jgi:hypothetical protein
MVGSACYMLIPTRSHCRCLAGMLDLSACVLLACCTAANMLHVTWWPQRVTLHVSRWHATLHVSYWLHVYCWHVTLHVTLHVIACDRMLHCMLHCTLHRSYWHATLHVIACCIACDCMLHCMCLAGMVH